MIPTLLYSTPTPTTIPTPSPTCSPTSSLNSTPTLPHSEKSWDDLKFLGKGVAILTTLHVDISLYKVGRMYFLTLVVKGYHTCSSPHPHPAPLPSTLPLFPPPRSSPMLLFPHSRKNAILLIFDNCIFLTANAKDALNLARMQESTKQIKHQEKIKASGSLCDFSPCTSPPLG